MENVENRKMTERQADEEDALTIKALGCKVPAHLIPGLVRYIVYGIPTGDFLRAVLSNDLFGAMEKADEESAGGMKQICTFLYSYAPSECRDSDYSVTKWIVRNGLSGS